jgi:hypothetical protein
MPSSSNKISGSSAVARAKASLSPQRTPHIPTHACGELALRHDTWALGEARKMPIPHLGAGEGKNGLAAPVSLGKSRLDW